MSDRTTPRSSQPSPAEEPEHIDPDLDFDLDLDLQLELGLDFDLDPEQIEALNADREEPEPEEAPAEESQPEPEQSAVPAAEEKPARRHRQSKSLESETTAAPAAAPADESPKGEPAGEEEAAAAVALTKKQSAAQSLFFWLQALSIALIALVLVFIFIGRIITVDGPSMRPTLENGDVLILQSIGYTPKQGDIVVLTKDFAGYTNRPIVKRVIAVGGQTVHIDYDEDKVYVDGVALDEPYILESDMEQTLPITDLTIPEGSIFVMGDNRNNSTDSRYPDLAAIDTRYVLGHVICILFPFSHFSLLT